MDMRNYALNENVSKAESSYVRKSKLFVCVCVCVCGKLHVR